MVKKEIQGLVQQAAVSVALLEAAMKQEGMSRSERRRILHGVMKVKVAL